MTGKVVYNPGARHRCMPWKFYDGDRVPGLVWECAECHTTWVIDDLGKWEREGRFAHWRRRHRREGGTTRRQFEGQGFFASPEPAGGTPEEGQDA